MTEQIPLSAGDRLAHLNKVLRSFRSITRETDPCQMLEKSCQMLTEIHGYFHAWIQLTDAREKTVKFFQAPLSRPFQSLKEKLMDGETVHCIKAALEKPGVIVIDSRHQTCADCPFFMNDHGGIGLVSRLEYKKRVFGTLTVYSEHRLLEYPDEKEFLADVASDIAYSLYSNEQSEIRCKEQAALAESEERHRAIFSNFPDAIFIADTQTGLIEDANPAASQFLKMPVESIVGLHQSQLHPAEMLADAKEIFRLHQAEAVKNQPSSLNEAVVLRSDGVRVPVEIKAQMVSIKGRLYLQGVFRDITKRKESEDIIKCIFKASPAGVGYVGPDRTLLRVNEQICTMTGRAEEELVGKNARILYPAQDEYDAVGKEKYKQIREKGTGIVETRWQKKNGEIIDVLLSSMFIDSADLSKGTIFSALDITERKTERKEIIKLSQAVEQSPASIVITGIDGSIEYINPKFTQITGYTLDEVKGQNPNILKSGNTSPEEYRELWDTITSGNVWEGEFLNKTRDGKLFWEKATIAPIFDEKGEIVSYLAIKKDITEQKALEAQLRQSQKMEAIGMLAGGISHDFNNLLTIINGYSAIVLADLDRSNPVFDKVQQIMVAGERAASLTR
jgi:PAS domain S-box-containing protein